MNRAAHSFFAAFVGWLLPFIGYLAWMQFDDDGFGYITDFDFLLFWPLLFTMIGWLVIGLPISLSLKEEKIQNLLFVLGIATIATTISFLAVAVLFMLGPIIFIWWPILIGLIGGGLFWLLQKYQPLRSWAFWVIPIAFFPFVRFVLLPIGIAYFPYTTHVLTEGATGCDALYAVIERVKVGDTYEELHRRYPQIFHQPVLRMSSSSGDGSSYSISFDDKRERVTKVEIRRNNTKQNRGADALPQAAHD